MGSLTLLGGARNDNIDEMVAECGSSCTCATCHAYVHTDWVEKLDPKEQMETDMLDISFESDLVRSRLSCQLVVINALDGLIVNIPEQQF